MDETSTPISSDSTLSKAELNWREGQETAVEIWKYYGGVGGADKDTMVKIVTWLLGLSAGIIALYATDKLTNSFARDMLFVLGIGVSIVGALTALLYGGYSTWNWAIADRIAECYNWRAQKPDYDPFAGYRVPLDKKEEIPRRVPLNARIPLQLAKPCQNTIAPIFKCFFFGSLGSLVVHAILLTHDLM
jgi:hypothetical protein